MRYVQLISCQLFHRKKILKILGEMPPGVGGRGRLAQAGGFLPN